MSTASGNKITASDMNAVINEFNNTAAKYRVSSRVATVSNNNEIKASTYNSMVSQLNQCISNTRYRRKKHYTGSTVKSATSNVTQAAISSLLGTMRQVYSDYCCDINCSCNTNCACNANCAANKNMTC